MLLGVLKRVKDGGGDIVGGDKLGGKGGAIGGKSLRKGSGSELVTSCAGGGGKRGAKGVVKLIAGWVGEESSRLIRNGSRMCADSLGGVSDCAGRQRCRGLELSGGNTSVEMGV
jgi:hypothetical protein